MPNFGTIPPGSPLQEAAYQRGYSDGVQAAIDAIKPTLSDDDRGRLGIWTKAIREWRARPERRAFEPPPAPTLR